MLKSSNYLFKVNLNSIFSIIKISKKTSFQNKSQYGSNVDVLDLLILQQSLTQFLKSLRFIHRRPFRSLLIFCKIIIVEQKNLLKIKNKNFKVIGFFNKLKILYYFICFFLLLVKKSNLTEINSFTRFQSSFNLKIE